MQVRAFAPGRVNLIGDHTDYTGGLVLPMALEMGTTVTGVRGGMRGGVGGGVGVGSEVRLSSLSDAAGFDSYVSAVASLVGVSVGGFSGQVASDLPIGAGLSSSASLEVAVALALGCPLRGIELARLCQDAELLASGVPCGIMDQLASVAGVEGCALLIDCGGLPGAAGPGPGAGPGPAVPVVPVPVVPVPVPPADEVEIVVIHSGQARRLAAGSQYADRRVACEAAERIVGPLRSASPAAVAALDDPVLRARARHVVSENARVRLFASALAGGDLVGCGDLMVQSHRSLAGDFEVSTPALDALVSELVARPGVFGARLTGAGFGGCVVALARPGAIDLASFGGRPGWRVRPGRGAFVEEV